jgi:hypothetical protein
LNKLLSKYIEYDKKINHYKNNYPSELSRSGKKNKKKINIFFVYGYFFFIY